MLPQRSASITELRTRLALFLDGLEESGPVMIVRHSKPAAYLISPSLFDALMEWLETVEDTRDGQAVLADYHAGRNIVPAEEVFARLGL
jgi:prevent-host-death family protein